MREYPNGAIFSLEAKEKTMTTSNMKTTTMDDFWSAYDRAAEIIFAEKRAACTHAPAVMVVVCGTVEGETFAPCCPLCGGELGERSYVRS